MKFFLILLFLFLTNLQAREYKAVFDCSSSNAHYIKTRMWLIDKTMSMIEKKGNKADFVITLHGSCVPMVSKLYDMVIDDEDIEDTKKAQQYLTHLAKERGVKVVVCAMSLVSNAIDKEDVLDFIYISENSFIDTIAYQNDGYALMTFK